MEGLIYNIEKYTTSNGPGFRTAVYLKGCPLRCVWCHSPEGQVENLEMVFDRDHCTYCYKCSLACNQRIVAEEEGSVFECMFCGECINSCPAGARAISGYTIEPEELIEKIMPEMPHYVGSGGGLTLTGGEPLLQPAFVLDVLKLAKEKKINTAIDTSGHIDFEFIAPVIPYTDYFLYDLKFINSELHKKYTGVDNKLILANLQRLVKKKANIILRIPLIEEINASMEEMQTMAKIVHKLGIQHVELIPYDNGASDKHLPLGKKLETDSLKAPSKRKVAYIKNLFHKVCKDVKIIEY